MKESNNCAQKIWQKTEDERAAMKRKVNHIPVGFVFDRNP